MHLQGVRNYHEIPRTHKLQLWPRIVVVRSTTHAAAVMVKILSDGDTGKGREEKEVASLLDRLRSPTPADMARSRKIRSNQPPSPPRGKRTCRRALASDPKGVTLRQRVKEFPTEPFTVSHGQLFCSACREQLSLFTT